MAEIYLIKTWENNFRPAYDSDIEEAKKFKIGEAIKVKFTKPRNYDFLKKFMSLIKLTFDNQDHFTEFDQFRKWVIMSSGHYIETITPNGSFFEPKSLKFSKMDEVEFQKVYSDVLNFCISYLDVKKEDIVGELINYA